VAFSYPSLDLGTLAIVASSVGIVFLLPELSHKFTAQRYGYWADYDTHVKLYQIMGFKLISMTFQEMWQILPQLIKICQYLND
jgi:hypothetical protein